MLDALKKEAYLQGCIDAFFTFLAFFVFVTTQFSIPKILKLPNKPKSMKHDAFSKRERAWVLYWISTTISALFFYFLLKSTLSALLNPEFWALQSLIETLGNKSF
jgi:hypothetical protein